MERDYDDDTYESADDGLGRYRSFAEKIQVGDAQEGAEALRDLITETVGNRRSVKEELADMALQAETDEAINGFKKKYPKIADDPILGDAARTVLRDQIVDDLKSVGLTEEQIAPARGDINRLVAVHGQARRQGLGVRKAGELLEATGGTLSKKFGISPASRSHAEVVADMRRGRGYLDDGSSGIVNRDVRERGTQPASPAAPRRINPAGTDAARAERARGYLADRRAAWSKGRGIPTD